MGEELIFSGLLEDAYYWLVDWVENMIPLILIGSEG